MRRSVKQQLMQNSNSLIEGNQLQESTNTLSTELSSEWNVDVGNRRIHPKIWLHQIKR